MAPDVAAARGLLPVFAWTVVALLALQAAPPGGATVPPADPAPQVDPATATFSTEVGLLLVTVKPDKTADYESAMHALQGALASTTDPAYRSIAAGWRVYKAAEGDAKGNAIYLHALLPAVAGVDYRPSMLLDQLLAEAPAELLAKYRDALAGPPTKLSLAELANMAVAPVKK